MKTNLGNAWLLAALVPLLPLGASAQAPSAASSSITLPADLPTASARHAAALKPITDQRDQRVAAAKASYTAALNAFLKDATARGDLDMALAVKAERDELAADAPTDAAKGLPKAVLPYRQRFDQAKAQASAQAIREEIAVTRSYIATLGELQNRITKQGDLDAAVAVKEMRLAAIAKITALQSGKDAAPLAAAEVAVAPPRPAPTSAPAPGVPAAPPGAALPMPAPAAGITVPAILVAAELKAKGDAKEPAPDTVVFDCPPGDGRRGAKGILLKQDVAAMRGGSTWAFRYTWAGSAEQVQIIHSVGRGHAIAYLSKKGVGLATPGAWREIGWRLGDERRMRETSAFKKTFPLQEGEDYAVVSRLSAGGAYELFINGALVASGRASSGAPLSLELPEGKSFSGADRSDVPEFKAADGSALPLQWLPGWVGIIVGPRDNGENVCRDLRYYPAVADVALATSQVPPLEAEPAGDAPAGAGPIGRWAWSSGRVITISDDGAFVVDKGGGGKWRWTRRSKGEFTMIWDSGGYRDSLALSSDGKRITGSNNKGDKVNVTRLE